MQVLAVTPGNHANKTWRAARTYEFAAGWAMQPVVQAEAEKVAAAFPMAFHQHDGTWDLVALLGVQPGHSLAVSAQGQWLGRYIPALVRAYPFTLATPKGAPAPVLCVDESTGLVGEGGDGTAFFDGSGKPTEALSAIIELLRQVALSRARTRSACAALADAGLELQQLDGLANGLNDRSLDLRLTSVLQVSGTFSRDGVLQTDTTLPINVEMRDVNDNALETGPDLGRLTDPDPEVVLATLDPQVLSQLLALAEQVSAARVKN